ncbi:LytR family transcriptional regulator [Knoellia flava TL1]|uniref:DNA-binding response regulator n=2 Tax=Knoellia flava TaxID=913969 RepID=A0A8H9KQT8_9MICO|nr:LytTR family DNA-binding domain-containing protein [Knoellia flava]KGN29507.1 LytR family transcriptional regulator [Knoellia flava TL1]GGB75909.1 DNA-binding response regulator [Knoellia flava]
MATAGSLRALVVDDELPALSEVSYLLGSDDRIAEVITASSGTEALQVLEDHDIDVIFSDISMPGLDGMALGRVLARFASPPQLVFVTAHEQHAVDAFALAATDYVMKPVRGERLAEAVRRVVAKQDEAGMPAAPVAGTGAGAGVAGSRAGGPGVAATGATGATAETTPAEDETIPVELGGVTRFVSRSSIRWVEASGDYARLHTAHGSHLVRIPLAVLEERWGRHGFIRIHRSTLVALPHVTEVRMDHGRCSVTVGDVELQVSRRHTRELREVLLRRPGNGTA